MEPITKEEVKTILAGPAKPDLSGYLIEDFDFSGLDLSEGHAQGARFLRCAFRGTELSRFDFDRASLESCDLERAVLVKANFFETRLISCSFAGANLNRAEFTDAEIRGCRFDGSSRVGTCFETCTIEDTTGLD